ncbi:MAG: hypothetical protein ACJ8AO_10100 [Gemmatimonadaceae bacterium]
MKLPAIFRFELAYQARRAWPWLFFVVLLVIAYLLARDSSLAEALHDEFFVNSPFSIAKTTVIGSVMWLLIAPPVAGDAAARDVGTGMHPLTYTLPISKADYLGGRFLAALVLNALLLLAVQAGILLAVYLPGVAPALIGPFRPAAYLTAYAYVTLPTAFVATALQFALALRSGRAMSSYVGSVLLMFVTVFIASLLLFRRELGRLLDPVGMRFILEDLSHQWTTVEKSWRLLELEGAVLANRLLWVGVGLATLAVTYLRFRFEHRVESTWWSRLRLRSADSALRTTAREVQHSAPRQISAVQSFGLAIDARKTLAIAWTSFRSIVSSLAGRALLSVVPLMTVLVVIDQMVAVGTPLTPRTALVLRELTGGLTAELAAAPSRWVIIPLAIVFFAGELVWRERDAGLGEITDAMPGSDWVPLLGKVLGLGLVLALFMTLLTAAGMVAQAILGYRHFEIGLYLEVLLGLQLPEYLLFAVLAVVVHVLVDQKYVGHLVAVVAYAFTAVLARLLEIEHNLLVYGRGPGWSYTEMRGFGGSLGPWAWFKLYWAAWAVLLAVAAKLLWVRGREGGVGARLREARRRLTRPTTWTAAAAAALVLSSGGFIFYNTNVLNEYHSSAEIEERRARYERRYRRYENVPQPRLTATSLRVEIFPERRAAEIRGTHRLVNASAVPIDSIHVVTAPGGVETRAVTFGRTARLALDDREHGYRIYVLDRPLAPGDSLRLDFDVRARPRGFHDRGADRSVTAKASAFSGGTWIPLVGYQRSRELLTAAARREHGLAPRPILGSLYDVEGREPASRGGGIAFEAVVGTGEDQVAVAPGALRRTWTEHGRRYFHYATSAPIGSEWSFFSARYAVREERWTPATGSGQPVTIRMYHYPPHTGHLERTLRAVRASMDYYSAQFGRYPYDHLTIVEQPGAPGYSMHADASMVTHGESFPFWTPVDGRLDMPYWVVAHEMGHQWGLPYALVEGLPFLAEGLATYEGIQVVKTSRGEAHLRQLMAFLRRPYPYAPIRRGQPLLRALDPHMARRWGPFAMYALSEYMGADRVNGAIRRLTERSDAPGAPPVTTLDLYRELQAVTPDSLRHLLHDLFEVNTFWQLETRRATAKRVDAGTWRVTLRVRARKQVYDSAGVVTELPMDEWVPVGVFGEGPRHDELGAPLYVQMHRVRSGEQTITVTVPRRPALAGIDPHHLLDWEEGEDDDNIAGVTITH